MEGETPDKEIISSVLQGDRQLFAELVKRHQRFVFTIALRYTQNREDAEEMQANNFQAVGNEPVSDTSGTQVLNGAMRLLNADDATIITLFYKGAQSIEEIGKIFGITPNNAKVKLHRARQRLKEKMELHFGREIKEMCG